MPLKRSIVELRPTKKLAQAVFHASGNTLFYEEESLTAEDIAALKNSGVDRVYFLEQGETLGEFRRGRQFTGHQVGELPLGKAIDRAGYSPENKLLFPRGTVITTELLNRLDGLGLKSILLKRTPRELGIEQYRRIAEHLAAKRSRRKFEVELNAAVPARALAIPFDRAGDGLSNVAFDAIISGFTDRMPQFSEEKPPLGEFIRRLEQGVPRAAEMKRGFLDFLHSCRKRIAAVYKDAAAGTEQIDLSGVLGAAADLARALCLDNALFAMLPAILAAEAKQRPQTDDLEPLIDRAFGAAAWTTALAGARNFSGAQTVEAVTAAIIHDLGMLKIDRQILEKQEKLTKMEVEIIHRHPVYTLEILHKGRRVPAVVPSIVFQIHEREDGSGYPLRLQGQRIHPLAKTAAIADAYSTLISERPHGDVLPPHMAMRELLQMASQKKLEPDYVKSFADAVGLHPVGEWMRLADGRYGRVAALNAGDPEKPLISAVLDKNLEPIEPRILETADGAATIAEWTSPKPMPADPFVGF